MLNQKRSSRWERKLYTHIFSSAVSVLIEQNLPGQVFEIRLLPDHLRCREMTTAGLSDISSTRRKNNKNHSDFCKMMYRDLLLLTRNI